MAKGKIIPVFSTHPYRLQVHRIFWANGGLGCASVPNFWKVFHAGDVTVHRTEPEAFINNKVKLRNGEQLRTDYIILCTGFDKNYDPFDHDLQVQCSLDLDSTEKHKWAHLETTAAKTVDELLPVLRDPGVPLRDLDAMRAETINGEKRQLSFGPSRHYRRMIAPKLAAEGDRSIFFPGLMHNVYTPLVGEVQALWGVAFMLGMHDVPSLPKMEEEAAVWNAWTAKRYLTQGRKHMYGIYDFISVSVPHASCPNTLGLDQRLRLFVKRATGRD